MYLDDVARGEPLEITHHGHPIAHLIPTTNDAWAALIASKEIIPARTSRGEILSHPPRDYPATGPARS